MERSERLRGSRRTNQGNHAASLSAATENTMRAKVNSRETGESNSFFMFATLPRSEPIGQQKNNRIGYYP